MNIIMTGLEHSLAPISLRERLSFTKAQTGEMAAKIRSFPGILGCVLISTCNRTELYVTAEEPREPGKLLCQAAGADYEPYREAFITRRGDEAVRHLMEVAAGLQSRIWGEDQIISQVKGAISIARAANAADPVLETLFRWAVSAGKEVRTRVHLTALPTSAASMAVGLLEEKLGGLSGKSALVIGNGEMGRLSAELLHRAGCRVAVTLRTYRHGETVVPAGCGVVAYDERFGAMEGMDLLISATTSPHYTVTAGELASVENGPKVLVDLAIPRDIQPEVSELAGVRLYNVDDLGDVSENRQIPPEVTEILEKHRENFYKWLSYRSCITRADRLKQAIVERILLGADLEEGLPSRDLVELSVYKTVDLLMGGLSGRVTAEDLARCEEKIRSHTIKTTGKEG